MPHPRLRRHRFLLPLVLVAVSFCLTAWLHALVTLRAAGPAAALEASPLMRLVRDWGTTLLVVELVLLASCALGAMRADR